MFLKGPSISIIFIRKIIFNVLHPGILKVTTKNWKEGMILILEGMYISSLKNLVESSQVI